MFTSFVNQYKAKVVLPAIAAKMDAVGKAWVAEASRLAPVDTGFLRSSLGYTYNASTKVLNLYADAKYALFQEFGTRHHAAHPFMRPALSVVPRIWRGGLGSALSGYTTNLQAPNASSKYQGKTEAFAKGHTGGAKLKIGRGKFR